MIRTIIKESIRRMRGWQAALACAVALAFSVTGCDSVSCPLNNTVESVYNFYATTRDADGEFIGGATISIGDTLTVTAVAMGRDTVLVNKAYNKKGVSLPVSFYAGVDTLVFTFTDSEQRTAFDTIWVEKRNQHHFDDPSCSVHMFHEVLSVRSTHQLIDTIVVANSNINYDGDENFQVYFYTNESE